VAGYSFHEQAYIIFTYARANGNGRDALRVYQETLPDRNEPNHQTFAAGGKVIIILCSRGHAQCAGQERK
jgi:hypothetical protein